MSTDDDSADSRDIAERVSSLARTLAEGTLNERRAAARDIYDLCYEAGGRAATAIPVLLRCLSDPDDEIGESGSWGLAYCEPLSIEPLTDCLASADSRVKMRACDALGNIGDSAYPAHVGLRVLLSDPTPTVREHAAIAIGLIHDTSTLTIDALFSLATSTGAAERSAALHALGNIGQSLDDPAPLHARRTQILGSFSDENEDVRWSASYVLESLGLDSDEHAVLLAKLLKSEDSSRVRLAIVAQMKKLAGIANLADYVPIMAEVIRRGGPEAAEMCEVVGLLGPNGGAALPALLEALEGEAPVALNAVRALWAVDRRINESLPVLARLFEEHGETVCDIIFVIGRAAAALLPQVVEALASERSDLQWAAADALGALASDAPEVLSALEGALGHPSSVIKSAAVRAIARIGVPSVPRLVNILRDISDQRSEWAADALGRMKSQASDAADELRSALADARPSVSHWSAIALAKVAGDPIVLPILVQLVEDCDESYLRCEAVQGLAALGPVATEALPVLERALDDIDADVQAAAEEAIAAIRGHSN